MQSHLLPGPAYSISRAFSFMYIPRLKYRSYSAPYILSAGLSRPLKAMVSPGRYPALTLSVLMIVCFEVFAEPLVAVFNSEHDPVMADLACQGMRLYFLGYLFAGFNIAGTGYLSAVGAAKWAMITAILRGVAAIVLCALVMAALFGMTGVWLAFCAAEAITAGVMAVAMKKTAIVTIPRKN